MARAPAVDIGHRITLQCRPAAPGIPGRRGRFPFPWSWSCLRLVDCSAQYSVPDDQTTSLLLFDCRDFLRCAARMVHDCTTRSTVVRQGPALLPRSLGFSITHAMELEPDTGTPAQDCRELAIPPYPGAGAGAGGAAGRQTTDPLPRSLRVRLGRKADRGDAGWMVSA